MRFGNIQIVCGVQNSDSAVTFPAAFSETPTCVQGMDIGCGSDVTLSTTSFDHGCASNGPQLFDYREMPMIQQEVYRKIRQNICNST